MASEIKQKKDHEIEKSHKPAFTLIEALIFLFIFSLITVTFYKVYAGGLSFILNSKNRLSAIALANEKMEVVRNLAYDDIAHTTGDPAGNLQQNEDVVRSGIHFHVFTQIKNVDDPYDGTLGGSPNDANYIDYKSVKITVSWNSGQYSTSLSSRFVPPGIEQPSAGKGVLVINVSSDKAGGMMVPQSTVRIQNSDTGFDETHSTDDNGRLMLVGISSGSKKYKITVTKSGYETVVTLPPYPTTAYNPTHEYASVVAGAINPADIYQNELSSLLVKTRDYLGASIPNIDFHLKGGRKLGTDPNSNPPNNPIYNTDADYATGSDGSKDFGQVSPGPYEFTLKGSTYEIIGINPATPFSLIPGQATEVDVKVSPKNVTALLVTATQSDDGSPLAGATVHLTNGSGYDVSLTTGDDGLAFFPNVASPSFASGNYTLVVSATGYQDHSGSITISSGQLKEEAVSMVAQ